MPPKLTEKQKKDRKDERKKKVRVIEPINKDQVPELRDKLEKSFMDLQEEAKDADETNTEFLRGEWEDNITSNMQKILTYIEENEERAEKIEKKITSIRDQEMANIQVEVEGIQKLLETEIKNGKKNQEAELRKMNINMNHSVENLEEKLKDFMVKEMTKVKNGLELSIKTVTSNLESKITDEINSFYDTVTLDELKKRDRVVREEYRELLQEQAVTIGTLEAVNKVNEVEIEKLKQHITTLEQNHLVSEKKNDRNKKEIENNKLDIDEIDATTKHLEKLITDLTKKVEENIKNQDKDKESSNVREQSMIDQIRLSPSQRRESRVHFNDESIISEPGSDNRVIPCSTRNSMQIKEKSGGSISQDYIMGTERNNQSKIRLKAPVFKAGYHESPMDFLEKMRNYIRASQLNEIEMKCVLEDSLMYSAASWWRITRHEVTNFESFEKEFKEKFWSKNVISDIKRMIGQGRWNASRRKTRTEYAMDLYVKGKEAGMYRDEELVEEIARHFDTEIEMMLVKNTITNFKELIRVLEIKDRDLIEARRREDYRREKNKNEQENRERGGQSKEENNVTFSNDRRDQKGHYNRNNKGYNENRRQQYNRTNTGNNQYGNDQRQNVNALELQENEGEINRDVEINQEN